MTERIRKAYRLTPAKPHKYHARRTNGKDSAKEADYISGLRLLEKAGKIGPLNEQVPYTLLPADKAAGYPRPLVYIADATFFDPEIGKVSIVDVKGILTPVYRLKKRLMKQLLGLEITEV